MLEGGILILFFLVLTIAGVPVALAMGASGIVGFIFFVPGFTLDVAFREIGSIIWTATYSWLLICVVFFMLMAEFMSRGQLAENLFEGLSRATAGIRGSLAMALAVGCALFGLTTGSGIAEVAAIGRISIPSMLKRKYHETLALGSVAASGALGFLVPPSIFLIIYAAWAEFSVARLFAAGLMPGFIMAGFLMSSVAIWVRINPEVAPATPRLPVKERVKGIFSVWPVLLVGGMVLGLIFAGIATPNEASGGGAILALLLVLARPSSRHLVNRDFLAQSAITAVRLTAMVLFIYVGARIMAQVWNLMGLPIMVAHWVAGLEVHPMIVLIIMYFVLLILGCIMDGVSMVVVTLPIFLPLLGELGFNPIWFGVMMGMLVGCAQITPPVGMSLYTVKAIYPQYPFLTIVRGSMPFLLAEVAAIILLSAFPQISLWLPQLIFGP